MLCKVTHCAGHAHEILIGLLLFFCKDFRQVMVYKMSPHHNSLLIFDPVMHGSVQSCWSLCCLYQICQVGRKRSYPPKDEASVDQMRQEFLERRCSRKKESCLLLATSEKRCSVAELEGASVGAGDKSSEGDEGNTRPVKEVKRGLQFEVSAGMQHAREEPGVWAANFKPRSGKECVRNCSQIDQSVKEHIVETLAKVLLQTENWVELTTLTSECESSPDSAVGGEKVKSTDLLECQLSNGRKLWNCGGQSSQYLHICLFNNNMYKILGTNVQIIKIYPFFC